MLYKLSCDVKQLLDEVKKYCAIEASEFIETGNESDVPENLKPLIFAFMNFHGKYNKLLEIVCDELPKIV